MKKSIFALIFLTLLIGYADSIEKIKPAPEGVELINSFFAALQTEDPAMRLKEVLPLVHKSLKNKDGSDLDNDTKPFSYKRACDNYIFYEYPVKITQVHKGRVMTIGFGETAETGRTDKYFVAKKKGVNGMPAPIHVFWPEGGGKPKLVNFGSL